jgi:Ca2+-binding EF-hand superfamily protein
LGELRAAFLRKDKYKRGRAKNDDVREVLEGFGVKFGPQEWTTLTRRFQFADSDSFRYNDFLAIIT